MNVGTALRTPAEVIQSLIDIMDASIYGVALAVFVVGAFLFATSGLSTGDASARKNTGKDLMIGAIIGFFLVKAAWLIFGTVLLYLYGP